MLQQAHHERLDEYNGDFGKLLMVKSFVQFYGALGTFMQNNPRLNNLYE